MDLSGSWKRRGSKKCTPTAKFINPTSLITFISFIKFIKSISLDRGFSLIPKLYRLKWTPSELREQVYNSGFCKMWICPTNGHKSSRFADKEQDIYLWHTESPLLFCFRTLYGNRQDVYKLNRRTPETKRKQRGKPYRNPRKSNDKGEEFSF